jgi:hypothetical protein
MKQEIKLSVLLRSVLAVILLLVTGLSNAQDEKLQGIYMYSFTRYIQWPEELNQGDFVITIIGESPMVDELQNLADRKKVEGRDIKLVRVNSVEEVKKCHILFLPNTQSELLLPVLSHISNWPTLVVTQQEGLGKKGSCINFIIREGSLAFELNMTALTKHQLQVFAELTRRAIII